MTIGKLPDKVLLKIFRHYLDVYPHLWLWLVQICRRWRRIVFVSQRALRLRICCTRGTPALKTLDHWPTLPIVVNFHKPLALDPPAPKDEDNILAALTQSCRVISISLTVTISLLKKISAVGRPFSKLENLALQSQDVMQLSLPSTFRWGPRLRSLCLTRISSPTLARLLYSSTNVVDLQLHEIPGCQISPATLANALSQMEQLQSLSLHFLSTSNHIFPSESGERNILSALSHLNLQGNDGYLEGLLARIDAPVLWNIEITFSDKPIFDLPKLREFVNRIEIQKSHPRADILSSERSISVSLTRPGTPSCLKFQVLCKTQRSQPFFMAQICGHFSAFLFCVEDLRINTTQPSTLRDDGNRGQWLEIIRRFRCTKWVHMAGKYSTDIARALQLSCERRREPVLPSLHKLCIREPKPHYAPLREAIAPFVHSCWVSRRFVAVEYERLPVDGLGGAGTTYAQF